MAKLRGRSAQLSHSQVISRSLFSGSDLAAVRNSAYSDEAQISAKRRSSVRRPTGEAHWQQGMTEPLPRITV